MNRKPEWTLVAAAAAATLNWLVGFQWDGLSAEQAALVMTAINAVAAVFTAWRTRPVPPNVWAYGVASLAAVGTAYGAHWTQESVALFTAAMVAVLGAVMRQQVSPVESVDPSVLGKPPV